MELRSLCKVWILVDSLNRPSQTEIATSRKQCVCSCGSYGDQKYELWVCITADLPSLEEIRMDEYALQGIDDDTCSLVMEGAESDEFLV